MKRIPEFIKSHYLVLLLIMYGVFIVFFRAGNGSFDCDEAIYSQVAREGLARNIFLTLYWKGQAWFEKPPLMIWMTMLSFKLFGISEFSAHIFSGIFGVLGAISAYFLGREIFENKTAGFLSGFILLSTPLFIWSMRSNMMDTALIFFVSLSVFGFWKSIKGDSRWTMLFWVSMALAVMTKSAAGLLPGLIACAYSAIERKNLFLLKTKYFYIGFAAFILILLPWHVYMSLQYGKLFWGKYLGFHVISRFTSPILNTPWDNNPFAYIGIYLQRSGVWPIILAILVLSATNLSKSLRSKLLFLGVWALSLLLALSLLKTKFPHYFIPVYVPLALIMGGLLSEHIRNKSKLLLIVALASLLNLLPFFFLLTSGYGESQLFVTKFLTHVLRFNETLLACAFFVSAAALIYIGLKSDRKKATSLSVLVIISMFLAMPFRPDRSAFIKSTGMEMAKINNGRPMNIYLGRNKVSHLKEVLPFYLPLGSRIEKYEEETFNFSDNKSESSYCFFEKKSVAEKLAGSAVFSSQGYIVVPCGNISKVRQ